MRLKILGRPVTEEWGGRPNRAPAHAVLCAALRSWQANSWFDALPSTLVALWRGMILISIAVLLIQTVSWLLDRYLPASGRSRTGSSGA